MTAPSQQPGYFDALYAANPDPWGFETRDYEHEKYAATLSALPRKHFASCLEVGCSIGVLTEKLGSRCDRVLGIDIAEAALVRARLRCRGQAGVRFERSELPMRAPDGPFDLIILSEVLYYFDALQIDTIARQIVAQTTPETIFALVHWLGPTPDYPLTGEAATAAFEAAMPELRAVYRRRTPQYRIDVFDARTDGPAVPHGQSLAAGMR